MIRKDKHNRINVRVRPGSALERFIHASSLSTATDALHELAAKFEALGVDRGPLREVK